MRDRFLMPILVPVGVAATIALLIFSMGHVLLEVSESDPIIATLIAIIGASFILGICTLMALAPNIKPGPIYTATALPAAVVIAFGLWLAVRPAGSETGGHGESAPTAAVTSATVVGRDNVFATTALTVPANQPVTIIFENQGAAIHNWHVLNVQSATGGPITTQLLTGGRSETITFTIAAPGTYDVVCDVHVAEMRGKLTVQ